MRRRAFLATALLGKLAPGGTNDPTRGLPVLTYHRFDPTQSRSATVVTKAVFAAQMAWLVDQKFRVVALRDAVAKAQGTVIPGPAVAITADDGWRSVYTDMFPVLQRYRLQATLFINPPMIGHGGAYLTWAMITEMVHSGLVEVQPHTLTHPNFNTERARRDPEAYQSFVDEQIHGSRVQITERLGSPADLLAWPYGVHDAFLEKAAAAAGCRAAFALGSRAVSVGDPVYALPRYQIYESDGTSRFAYVASGYPRLATHAKGSS